MIILNMICKNEAPRIERALASVAQVVGRVVILDTGSTDETIFKIRLFCQDHDIPCYIKESIFKDFSTSRNEALAFAKKNSVRSDYILLMDADMELRDPEANWDLTLPTYRMLQRHEGGLTYWNTRLVRADVEAVYRGVTHEYLDVGPGGGPPQALEGPWFLDHADGGNRPGKFERDIALLRAALDADPTDARSTFYLAQSYRDLGDKAMAKMYYEKRSTMEGTWEEERWRAALEWARLHDDNLALMGVYNQRPTRAEPLHDLARRLNEARLHAAAAMVASWGMTIPRPDDILFVEDATYQWGLRQEFSIAANYHPDARVKALGRRVCDELSLDRGVPDGVRWLAHANYHFYIQSAEQMFHSWRTTELTGFTLPPGLSAMGPSICRHNGALWTTLRAVNYDAGEDRVWFTPRDGAEIKTRNFLLQLSDDGKFTPLVQLEILLPEDWPVPVCTTVRGVEDLRLVSDGRDLWVSGNTREFTPQPGQPHGWCQMIEARLEWAGDNTCARMVDWKVISTVPPVRHEKNWMPLPHNNGYVYLCDPLTLHIGRNRRLQPPSKIHAERFRGSTQFIPWGEELLGVIHEVEWRNGMSYYRSRFVELSAGLERIIRVSRPFYFHNHGLEIAMGLAHGHEANVLVGYSFKERSPWIGSISTADIDTALGEPL